MKNLVICATEDSNSRLLAPKFNLMPLIMLKCLVRGKGRIRGLFYKNDFLLANCY